MKRHRIELDFSGRPRRTPGLGLAVLAVGAVLALLSTVRMADALAARATYRADLEEMDSSARPHTKAAPKAPADGRALARGAASKQVAQALQSPWAELLAVMDVKPEGQVALLAVEPSAVKRTVHITAEARDEAAMLQHLSMLQQDPRLSGVTLTSHQRQSQTPGAPWRYQIEGTW
jgi:HAMP domain-containing protein